MPHLPCESTTTNSPTYSASVPTHNNRRAPGRYHLSPAPHPLRASDLSADLRCSLERHSLPPPLPLPRPPHPTPCFPRPACSLPLQIFRVSYPHQASLSSWDDRAAARASLYAMSHDFFFHMFPFHLIIDTEGCLVQAGAVMSRCGGGAEREGALQGAEAAAGQSERWTGGGS